MGFSPPTSRPSGHQVETDVGRASEQNEVGRGEAAAKQAKIQMAVTYVIPSGFVTFAGRTGGIGERHKSGREESAHLPNVPAGGRRWRPRR